MVAARPVWSGGSQGRGRPFTRSPIRPLPPPRHRLPPSLYVHASIHVYTDTYTRMWTHRGSLFLSSELSSLDHSLLLLYLGVSLPLALRRVVSALDPNASAALTKLPVFVLREIAGYCTPRVNTIIDPLHFATSRQREFVSLRRYAWCVSRGRIASCILFLFLSRPSARAILYRGT